MSAFFESIAHGFDFPILDWIARNLRCGFLDAVMPIITLLGDAGIFWIIMAAVLLFFPKTRKIGLTMGTALLIGLLVCNVTMKPLFARTRPYALKAQMGQTIQLLIDAPPDFAFPSGHTLASFEAATAITIYNKKWGIAALVLAALISFSRLYLYVHYVTDVLFSLGAGIGIAFLAAWLVRKGYALYEAKKCVE